MPFTNASGFRMHYQVNGSQENPALLLSNSLGTSLDMWAPQVEAWSRRYCVIRYDTRGHVQSETPQPPYTIEAMAQDTLALLDTLHIDRVDVCGLSMGGMIAMWIAINRPDRVRKLVLANTSAVIGSCEIWNSRIEAVTKHGMDAVVGQVQSRWFSPEFRNSHADVVHVAESMLRNVDPQGYAHCCRAIRDADLHSGLKDMLACTLIISGEVDPVIPTDQTQLLAAAIRGSNHIRLPAAHLSNMEQPERFTRAVLDFLN